MGGDDGSSQMGYQHCADLMLNCPSSGMNTRPLPDKIAPMTMSSVYGSSWDPVVSLRQSGNFGGVSSVVSQNQEISSSSQLVNYSSDLSIAHMLPKLPMLGSGSFPDFVNLFGIPGGIQNFNAPFPQNFASNQSEMDEKPSPNAVQADRDCNFSEGTTVGMSPDGKRKRDIEAPSSPNKNAERNPQKDHTSETSGPKQQDDKRQKTEQNSAGNSSAKQAGKQLKDDSQDEEAPKQNYIHVRARRGQATNSHSLAERVRREKISERMRLLQELVPGCNKITGKAVMLDEIINYVQSLQQQVEFLSMKLATVNPELNLDIEQLLAKDIFHQRGNNLAILGFDPGMSSSHAFTPGIHQGNLTALSNAASQYHHMSQAVWDNDLQNVLHMGFDSNPAVGSLGPNGSSKAEI